MTAVNASISIPRRRPHTLHFGLYVHAAMTSRATRFKRLEFNADVCEGDGMAQGDDIWAFLRGMMPAMRDTPSTSPFFALFERMRARGVGLVKETVPTAMAVRMVLVLVEMETMWAEPVLVRWGREVGVAGGVGYDDAGIVFSLFGCSESCLDEGVGGGRDDVEYILRLPAPRMDRLPEVLLTTEPSLPEVTGVLFSDETCGCDTLFPIKLPLCIPSHMTSITKHLEPTHRHTLSGLVGEIMIANHGI
ncbi:hypothetical protein HRS9139_10572 [Pyrenophora teres f. teres]|nr:hypothetical protein HRS9139_10572 [Pyrenophora teres f. teres]